MNLPNKITLIRFVLCVVTVILLIPYESFGLDVYRIGFAPDNLQPLVGAIEGLNANQVPFFGFSILDLLACILFVLASITDSIDGAIARKTNQITNFGKLMDPLADKFLVDGTLIMLCFRGYTMTNVISEDAFLPLGIFMPTLIVVFMIGRDLLVDGVKMVAASQGKVIAANSWGKAKTVSQMIIIPFYILNGFPFYYLIGQYTEILMIVLISGVLVLSIVSGIIYTYNGRYLFKDLSNKN